MAYQVADIVGRLAFIVVPGARHNLEANLAQVLDASPRSAQVRRTARQAFVNNTRNWIDTLRLPVVTGDEIEDRLKVEGWDSIARARDCGQGILLVGMHLGNVDLVGQLIATRGLPMTIPVEEMRPERLFRRTQELRRQLGLRPVPLKSAGRAALTALRKGEVVGVLCDRNAGDAAERVTFFRRQTAVSRGPAWLATKANCTVLLAYGIRTEGINFQGFLQGPLNMARTGDEEQDIHNNAQTIMSAVEDAIRQYPGQWAMFAPIWTDLDQTV